MCTAPALSSSSPPPTAADEVGAAALLMGTAIGGGFLALPHATAPSGAGPSSAVLIMCWCVLLLEALLVSDLVVDQSSDSEGTVSYATLGREAFGEAGGRAVSTTFVILMITTLVSQLAKGASLLAPIVALPFAARCALLAGGLAAFGRTAPPRLVNVVNLLLTAGFVAATLALFGQAAPHAVWARLGRADWSACLASAPTLLQLHVYCEVVPSICQVPDEGITP
jgi:amino acid permease